MFYKSLYYFGFLPKLLQVLILAVIFIAIVCCFVIFKSKHIGYNLFLPSVLLTVSFICERLLRWFGNNTNEGKAFVIGVILILLAGYAMTSILNFSGLLSIAFMLILATCLLQSIFLIAVMPIAIILLIIVIIKSIFRKDFRQVLFSLFLILVAYVVPDLSWIYNYVIVIFFLLGALFLLQVNFTKSIIYLISGIVMTMLFSPWIAIEVILIIEQLIRCIKSGKLLGFFMAMLANFFAFWVIGVIFNLELIALIFVIIVIIFVLKIMGI